MVTKVENAGPQEEYADFTGHITEIAQCKQKSTRCCAAESRPFCHRTDTQTRRLAIKGAQDQKAPGQGFREVCMSLHATHDVSHIRLVHVVFWDADLLLLHAVYRRAAT